MMSIWLVLILLQLSNHWIVTGLDDLNELRNYEVVDLFHIDKSGQSRKGISFISGKSQHLDELKLVFEGFERRFIIKLIKNRELLPKSFQVISQNEDGSSKIHNNTDVENCFYHGKVENQTKSMVAISTCNGFVSGMITDENGEEFFIEPHIKNREQYVFYKMKDLIGTNSTCGHADHEATIDMYSHIKTNIQQSRYRSRRATNVNWKYIEVVGVVDLRLHTKYGKSVDDSKQKAIEIFNYVDAVYKTMQTRVALVSVIVWDKKDEIEVKTSPSFTLGEFSKYTRNVIHNKLKLNVDNAQLISGIDFDKSTVGLAGVGNMCSKSSSAVNQHHSSNPARVANTVAHELGHNLGFRHNTAACTCPNPPCVMGAYSPSAQAKGFTSCVKAVFDSKKENDAYPCLDDYPDHIIGSAKCGDGFKEDGEECDCGNEQDCKASGLDKCCNFTTCTLNKNAECADGTCCEDCKFKTQGIQCRNKMHNECDLEEYCTGSSAHCPRNFFVADGKSCQNNQGYCYEGLCRTHVQQCQQLWGINVTKARERCFELNENGDGYGNCGPLGNDKYKVCSKTNLQCGKIQCEAKPGKTMPTFPNINFGKSVKTWSFSSSSTKTFYCKAAKLDLTDDLVDPTLTFDGTKCADNSICIGQSCVKLSSINIKKCDQECRNGGVCNSNGHCHCPKGFACPYCEQPGKGGSLDSGQGCLIPPKVTTNVPTKVTTNVPTKVTTKVPTKVTTKATTRISGNSTTVIEKDTSTSGLEFVGLLAIIPVALIIILLIIYLKRRAKRSDSDAKHPERFHSFKFASQLSHENEGFTKLESDKADQFRTVQQLHPMAKPLPKKTVPSQENKAYEPIRMAPPTKPMAPPAKPVAPSTKPMAPPTKPMAPPTKPMAPPTKPMAPSTKPMAPPTKPTAPLSKPTAPPTKPMAPPTKPMALPTKPMAPPTKPMALPTKTMAPPTKPMASPTKPMVPPPRPTVRDLPNSRPVQPPVRPKLTENSEQDFPTIPKKPLLPPKSTMAHHSNR